MLFSRNDACEFPIDGALCPDVEPPTRLDTLEERVDFLARLCAA